MRSERSAAVAAIVLLAACKVGGGLMPFQTTATSSSGATAPGTAPAAASSPAPASAEPATTGAPVAAGSVQTIPLGTDPGDPPGPGQIGAIVVGPIGFGQCANPGRIDAHNAQRPATRPERPADPFAAVAGDVPAALPLDSWQFRRDASVVARSYITGCDAAHDHCFRDCTWLVRPAPDNGGRTFLVWPSHRTTDGNFHAPSSTSARHLGAPNRLPPEEVVAAYRTVPATRALLVEGRLVAVQEVVPSNEPLGLANWTIGRLGKVDFDAGTVQLKGSTETYPLAATRVVVLTSVQGGPVQLTEGLTRESARVDAKDVFLPSE